MKIVILCGTSLDSFQLKVMKPIMEDRTIEIVGALIDSRPRPSLKKRFINNLRRGRGGYMIIMLFKRYFTKREFSMNANSYFTSCGITYMETPLPYSEDTALKLKALQADVLVMLGGFGIVKEPLLSLAPKGVLSYHHGDMRKYRGQPVGFWELYNNEKEMGVTVQSLSMGLDKGIPIVEKTIPIEKKETLTTLRNRALDNSTTMMHEALCLIQKHDFQPEPISNFGHLYTLPNLSQYLKLIFKLLLKR